MSVVEFIQERSRLFREAAKHVEERVRYRCDECNRIVWMNKLDSVEYWNAPNAIGGGDGSGAYGPETCASCFEYTPKEIIESYRDRVEGRFDLTESEEADERVPDA